MTSVSNFPETPDIETSSDDYAQRFAGKIGSWFLSVQERTSLRMLASYPQATILDVGGGHGQLASALIHSGYRVTVLGSAEICQKRIQPLIEEKRCSFKIGNILDLPFPDQAFDVVISFRLLPHVNRWRQLVAELSRVARNAVIVDYPTVRSINVIAPLLFQYKKHLEGNTRPFTLFRERELLEVFQSFGFVRADRYPEFFFPMVFHRVLRLPGISSTLEAICRLVGLTPLFGSPVITKLIRTRG